MKSRNDIRVDRRGTGALWRVAGAALLGLAWIVVPAAALAQTGTPPVPPSEPVNDPVAQAIPYLLLGGGVLAVIVAYLKVPFLRPLIAFALVAGAFGVAALIVWAGVSLSHMDTGMTPQETFELNLRVGALLLAGLALGLAAGWFIARRGGRASGKPTR